MPGVSWGVISRMAMFRRSIFSLTWVLAAAILPFTDPAFARAFLWAQWDRWLWIALGLFTARFSGMAFNAYIDRHIDAENPRTQDRVLPSGQATPKQIALLAWGSLFAFVWVCAQINAICLAFSPIIALLLWGYAYVKRFSSLCHFVLGLVQFFAPIMAWAAITDGLSLIPVWLGLALFLLITANDIIYGMQDREFDMAFGVRSIPVALGPERAVLLTRVLFGVCVASLGFVGAFLPSGNAPFLASVAMPALLFIKDQRDIKNLRGLALARRFARSNTLAGLFVFAGAVGAVLWRG